MFKWYNLLFQNNKEEYMFGIQIRSILPVHVFLELSKVNQQTNKF